MEPGEARKSQKEPEGGRRSQEEPGGARRSQEEPVGDWKTYGRIFSAKLLTWLPRAPPANANICKKQIKNKCETKPKMPIQLDISIASKRGPFNVGQGGAR